MGCAAPQKIRNIGIIAHIDAGKTTLSERILYYCQKIHRLGEVHDGAATMDFMPEEQERGITITSACTTCFWRDIQINLIDTPGHVDFTMEVQRSLAVLDGAIGVFCGVAGVEPQSETVWRQAESFAIPKLAFINKMDRQGADFKRALESIRQRLKANAVAVCIPLGEGEEFSGVIDLINMRKLFFDPKDQGKTVIAEALSEDEEKLAAPWREKLLESVAEADDTFIELWMNEKFNQKDLIEALQRATIQAGLVPVFCGSALRNKGIQPLLDAIRDFLPSPCQRRPAQALAPDGSMKDIAPDSKKPALGLIFKVSMENSRKNCFLRLYEGVIREGDTLYNGRTQKAERVGRLARIHADRREQLSELCAGDIGIITGIRDGQTGDTLRQKGLDLLLEPIRAYAPVITLSLEPANAEEGKILDEALDRYLEEDPTLKKEIDEDSGMRLISGMGELHLEVLLERLAREYKITPRSGQPQAVLRETAAKAATAIACFDRELGKERHQGEVSLAIMPTPRGAGLHVRLGDFLPANEQERRKILPNIWLDAVMEGVSDTLQTGLNGWPLADLDVTVTDIKKTDGLTTIPGLRMAAALALRDAMTSAGVISLEPIMAVEITSPEDFLGAVINLFNQCGGKVENLRDMPGAKWLSGLAPLRKMFGFSTRLRSATQGRAAYLMTFNKFDQA